MNIFQSIAVAITEDDGYLPKGGFMAGTEGRVYGGDCNLVHVQDGMRAAVAQEIAQALDHLMRARALANGQRNFDQLHGDARQHLCPGCYMVVMFDTTIWLARENGQSIRELGATMSNAYNKLMVCGDDAVCIESIEVILEQEGDALVATPE